MDRLSQFKKIPFFPSNVAFDVNIFVGVISGQLNRRVGMRCLLNSLYYRFFIGEGENDHLYPDVVVVPVKEGINRFAARANRTLTGSLTSSIKMVYFLRYAAKCKVSHVVRVDDDTFLVPSALYAYIRHMPIKNMYGGVFEFYNYIDILMKSTGNSVHSGSSRYLGLKYFNCTTKINSYCRGPFAFAKGPLLILSSDVVQALSHSSLLENHLIHTQNFVPTNRVDDDVQLGYWLTNFEKLTYIRIMRNAWFDRSPRTIDRKNIISVHRLPWPCRKLISINNGNWRNTVYRSKKVRAPPCRWLHHPSQRIMVLEVKQDSPSDKVSCNIKFSPYVSNDTSCG